MKNRWKYPGLKALLEIREGEAGDSGVSAAKFAVEIGFLNGLDDALTGSTSRRRGEGGGEV